MNKNYLLLKSRTFELLEDMVNEQMAKGWMPLGPPVMYNNYIAQAMTWGV